MPDLSMSKQDLITHDEVFKLLSSKYERARMEGSLKFYESTDHVHSENGIDFEIKLCPALLDKPTLPTPEFKTDTRADPFEQPYTPFLYIGDLGGQEYEGSYALLLNKFSLTPNHFILATKEFASQTAPLLPSDLLHAYLLLIAGKQAGQPVFAFFNCGERSGASQRHKHLQFLPTSEDGPPVEKKAKDMQLEVETRAFSIPSLPYAHYIRRIPSSLQSSSTTARSREQITETLTQIFLSLLDLVITTCRYDETNHPGRPSYNFWMTLDHVHLIPRAQEKYTLPETGDQISVNSLGFAGLLGVKSEKELEAVRKEGVGNILRGVAMGKVDVDEVNDREGGAL